VKIFYESGGVNEIIHTRSLLEAAISSDKGVLRFLSAALAFLPPVPGRSGFLADFRFSVLIRLLTNRSSDAESDSISFKSLSFADMAMVFPKIELFSGLTFSVQ